jgi:hypothetical protein
MPCLPPKSAKICSFSLMLTQPNYGFDGSGCPWKYTNQLKNKSKKEGVKK